MADSVLMSPEQIEATKFLHKAIKFEDRAYRGLLHRVEHGKPMQKLQALHKLMTKHGFDAAKLKAHGITPRPDINDLATVNAAIDVQRTWRFDMRVWPYVGVYITEAHIEFRERYLARS